MIAKKKISFLPEAFVVYGCIKLLRGQDLRPRSFAEAFFLVAQVQSDWNLIWSEPTRWMEGKSFADDYFSPKSIMQSVKGMRYPSS